jgi:subtilisin-like proprotein convertase family protein
VSGLSGTVVKVTVTINGVTHTFSDDLDFLLVGPGGQNATIWSDAGGSNPLSNAIVTLDDAAATVLPDSTAIVTGTYQPANYGTGDTWPAPAPAPSGNVALSIFNGTNPNGTWSLYLVDDAAGDLGQIAGGWTVTITTSGPCGTPTPTPTATATATPSCTPAWLAGPNFPSVDVRSVGVYFPGNGRFYAMGGRSADTAGSDFTHPFEFDPVANTWTTKAATYPDNQVNNMACGVLTDSSNGVGTGYIYCVGGSAAGATTATGRVFRYDPVTDTISPVAAPWPPGVTNIVPGGFTIFQNKLYILGGFDIPGGVATNQIWEFTPGTNAWVQKAAVLPVAPAIYRLRPIRHPHLHGWRRRYSAGAITDAAESFVYNPVGDSIAP